ncbi:hypothetical protein GCM10022420_052240 [Streptomyces iranensis]
MAQEIAEDVVDVVPVRTSLIDAGRVAVDPGDVRHGPPERAGEHALAAADVEGALGAIGDRVKDAGVVVDVVVPPTAVLHCHVKILPDQVPAVGRIEAAAVPGYGLTER